jgi:hypothetical protein
MGSDQCKTDSEAGGNVDTESDKWTSHVDLITA